MKGILRNLVEGLVFLLLFPVWMMIAFVSIAVGVFTGRTRSAGILGSSISRWIGFITTGTRLYRRSWWPLPLYESASVFWRHILWTELFTAFNAGARSRPSPERYLIIKLAHIGDAMHIGPMLKQLQREKPGADVDLLVGPWCRDLAERWKVSGRTWVYTPHLMVFHRGNKNGLKNGIEEFLFLRRLRKRKYTCVLSTSTLSMGEWLLIQAANPREWIGAENPVMEHYTGIPSKTEPYASEMYEADRVSGLLRYLGMNPEQGRPEYPVSEEERAWAEKQWGGKSPRIVIAPGAGWPGKMWPAGRFAQVSRELMKKYGASVAITGAPDESNLAEIIVEENPDALNLVGQTSFGQTAALVATADLVICNDSGPLHLAAAYEIPSVAVFGPTIALKWQPPGECHRMIQKPGHCEGCVGWHPAACCLHDNSCMKAVSVDEVVAEASDLIKLNKQR